MWLRCVTFHTAFLTLLLLLQFVSSLDPPGVQCPEVPVDPSLATSENTRLLPRRPTSSLVRRVTFPPSFLGTDWIIDHHDFQSLLPLTTAAASLQDFYEDIAAFAANTLSPPLHTYHFWMGEILLEIMGPRDSGETISWRVVTAFAAEMVSLTRRGYANTYQINFIHRPTGRMVTCSLWIGLASQLPWVPSR